MVKGHQTDVNFFLSQFFIRRGGGLIINPILSPSPNCEERTMAGICVPEKCSLLPWEAAAKPLKAVMIGSSFQLESESKSPGP